LFLKSPLPPLGKGGNYCEIPLNPPFSKGEEFGNRFCSPLWKIVVPLFGKEGQGEIFGEIFRKFQFNLKSPSPPLRKGGELLRNPPQSPFFKGEEFGNRFCSPLWKIAVPLFGKEGQGEIFGEIFGKFQFNLKSPSPPLRKGVNMDN